MKLLNIYGIKGPNVYSYKPVIVMEVDLQEYREVHTDELPALQKALVELFPGLSDHHCSPGYPGGFVERMKRGTLLGHVMEHLALELQSIVARPVRFGKTRFADEIQAYRLVFSYYNEQLGLCAGKMAFGIITALLRGERVDSGEVVAQLTETYLNSSYGTSTQALLDAAAKRGIPTLPLSRRSSLIQLGYGSKQQRIQATTTSRTSCIAVELACDKWETRELLASAGIPVARGFLVRNLQEALCAMQELGGAVVVKPLDGNQGRGVSVNISGAWELEQALELGKRYSDQILIEDFIRGNDYRLAVVNGRLVAASHRLPPLVVGDGVHTIHQLIRQVNRHRERGDGHEKPLTKIRIDQVVLLSLSRLGFRLDTVLPRGKEVFLRDNGNLSTGGTAYDVTEQVHPENRRMVERAVRLIGLDVAGVDLRTEEISQPVLQQGGAIIEINAAPGIRMHHYPSAGAERNVADRVIEMLFPAGDGRIPIIAITGTNGKTTTTRLIQHVLMQTGEAIGMTTTDGIYLNREMLFAGDTTGPWSAEVILKDPLVDVAVLETARGGILRSGLAFDRCDVGVVLNVAEDHLGLGGVETMDDLAAVKSLIIETVRPEGSGILNADNPYTVRMAGRCLGRVIYFSQNAENPVIQEHLQAGGTAFVAARGWIEMRTADGVQRVMELADAPMTYQGKARHQIENLLAATAALFAYGIGLEMIRTGVRTFTGDFETNPGRLNLIEGNGRKILLDYGHNPEGYRAVIDFTKAVGYRRCLGVIGVPGDRQDVAIHKVGKIAGEHFDRIWVKEDQDSRGRRSGEVAGLLVEEIRKERADRSVEVILSEKEAFRAMLAVMEPGDLGVIFFEKDPQGLLRLAQDYLQQTEIREKKSLIEINSSVEGRKF